jgi:hypothetical protein
MKFLQTLKQKHVLLLVVISAILVIAVRLAAPFEVGKDQSVQLEAAQRLVEGKGLTTTNEVAQTSLDVAVEQQLKYLTWWPPGFSLLVAAFLYAGLPLSFTLKFIYALIALAGWIGWGLLAQRFMAQPIYIGQKTFRVNLLLAILLPVFFTPPQGGTDIFLWAGIPFFFMLLTRSDDTRRQLINAAIAGLLFGCLYTIRYVSVFLGFAAMLILFQVAYPNIKTFIKRYAVFSLASLIFILPVTVYVRLYSQAVINNIPEEINPVENTITWLTLLNDFLLSSPVVSNAIFGFSLLEMVVYKLNWNWLIYLFGIFCLVVLLSVPLVLWQSQKDNAILFRQDRSLSLSLLPLSLLFFLSALLFAEYGEFISIRRYYDPIVFCNIFIFYEIASARLVKPVFQKMAMGFVASFLLYVCVVLPALVFVPERRDFVVRLIVSFSPSKNLKYASTSQPVQYPSNNLYSLKEGSRLKIKELYAANPDALFFVEEYGYFIYDEFKGGPMPGERLRVFLRKGYWQQAYTNKPIKMFWILNADTPTDFVPTDKQRIIYSDLYERTKIIEIECPTGQLFPTTPQITNVNNAN